MKKKFWIAVDNNGDTFLYSTKPIRLVQVWSSDDLDEIYVNDIFSHLNLTWESEPYEIEI